MSLSVARRRGRRALLTMGMALNATVLSLGASGLGATPAAAAEVKTETAFVPLQCNIGPRDPSGLSGGIPAHLGVAITATLPKSLNPGQKFRLRNVTPVLIDPPSAQRAAAAFSATQIAGVIKDFEQKLTNARGNFNPGGTGTQINTVAAMQPPNADAPPKAATVSQSSPRDPLVDPNTAHPSPLEAWNEAGAPQGPPVPATDPRRHDKFSFGPIPIDSTPRSSANAYGPVPGTGGGVSVTSGKPDPITVRPFTVTGSPGANVVIDVGDPSRIEVVGDTGSTGELVVISGLFFFNPNPPTGRSHWNGQQSGKPMLVTCGVDNSSSPNRVAKPDPAMVDRFIIPIACDGTGDREDNGGGSTGCEDYGPVSVIKSLPTAGSPAVAVGTAGAILVVLTTLLLVAVRRRRLGRP